MIILKTLWLDAGAKVPYPNPIKSSQDIFYIERIGQGDSLMVWYWGWDDDNDE